MNVFEKIIEKLEEDKEWYKTHSIDKDFNRGIIGAFSRSISVIQEVAEEHNNGWILCSEQMPKEHESIFANYEGMFKKASDMVLVTIVDDEGEVSTTYAHTMDSKWSCNLLNIKVIAWQPFPEPYRVGVK